MPAVRIAGSLSNLLIVYSFDPYVCRANLVLGFPPPSNIYIRNCTKATSCCRGATKRNSSEPVIRLLVHFIVHVLPKIFSGRCIWFFVYKLNIKTRSAHRAIYYKRNALTRKINENRLALRRPSLSRPSPAKSPADGSSYTRNSRGLHFSRI